MPDGSAGDTARAEPRGEPFWSLPAEELMRRLGTRAAGLSTKEARTRLEQAGANLAHRAARATALVTLARQFRSPLILILVFAAVVSSFVGQHQEAVIIGLIVLASCALGFSQEYAASRAMEALKQRISSRSTVLRDGAERLVDTSAIVPGDVIRLAAGNLIPADGVVLEAQDLQVSEAVLTGESFPVNKSRGTSPPDTPLARRAGALLAGTSVRSGTATMLAVNTGRHTEIAAIAASLERRVPETEFARGTRRFGMLMSEIMLAIVILALFANLLLHRPPIESLLFSLALAVGLTPELLPAIVSVTLARGARAMAAGGVIVRRLDAIENLGAMDLLCTDKTGTLTEGVVRLDGWTDVDGKPSPDVLLWAQLNATLQSGMPNPLDEAIGASGSSAETLSAFTKLDEVPYDFVRKRLSVVVRRDGESAFLICKGAVRNVLDACTLVRVPTGGEPLDAGRRATIEARFEGWSAQGFRVLGLAVRPLDDSGPYGRAAESDLHFAGFLLFLDPPKEGVHETLRALASRGVTVKIISGDNRFVSAHLAGAIGLPAERILTGEELAKLTKNALAARAQDIDLFVEIDPNQKERVIEALRSRGHVVGYLGDGINDAPALHEADIGISVEGAVDVAREAADMILLRRDLGVLVRGVDDGRATFANTMKYIAITTSANFGNMVSMAAASLFLPFLPLLAKQILLNNFLSEIPSLAISGDRVDREETARAHRWDIGYIRCFMVSFGLVSSVFDLLTFAFLIFVIRADAATFQTAWFVESLLTQLLILLIIRTRRPFWKSRPSALLGALTAAAATVAILLPYSPLAGWFGFVPLPKGMMIALLAITAGYMVASEATKSVFFRHEGRQAAADRRDRPRHGAQSADRGFPFSA